MAPFAVVITPIGYHKSELVRQAADGLYRELTASGVEVLLDDRDERPGVMFADAELVGIPHRVTLGERGLRDGMAEYLPRRESSARNVPLSEITKLLPDTLKTA